MRRALLAGLASFGVVLAFLALRPEPVPWVVEASADDVSLNFRDPCFSPAAIDGYSTQGGTFGGLTVLKTESEAEDLASCYRLHDVDAVVRRQTDADRDRLEEMSG